ncbi:MAG TPA: histidine kinase [Gemmatimonadaceae bacterium]
MMISRKRAWALAFCASLVYAGAQTALLALHIKGVPVLELYLYELPVWLSVIAVSPIVFWLAQRLPLFGPKAGRNFLAHLVLANFVLLLQFLLVEALRHIAVTPLVLGTGIASSETAIKYAHLGDGSILLNALTSFRIYSVFFLFVYFAAAVLYHSVSYHRELGVARLHSQELQTLLAKSQLDSLRLQLQPHFLFNTLNTVSSLMTRDVPLARRTLARLSDLLRETLRNAATHEVALASELESLAIYLEIQSARFGPRLVVEKRIVRPAARILVPRMLLQPLVENSIHHGMRDGDSALVIRIEAATDGNAIELKVLDNGAGLRNQKLVEHVGLRNTRERLEKLYGAAQSLLVDSSPGEGFSVIMHFPARIAEDTAEEHLEREIA